MRFTAKRITTVSKDFPLIVSDTSQPMEYDTIYFEQGGYIEIRCGSKFTINKILPSDDSIKVSRNMRFGKPVTTQGWDYDIIVTGRDGEDGGDGGKGGEGGIGGNGGNGGNGTPGESGKSRPDLMLIINDTQIDLSILNTGSKGGNGGKGGKGGDGGDGKPASGKDYDEENKVAIQGGKGGDGGNGANGGNGGQGCNLTIKWNSTNGKELTTKNDPGLPGEGGSGGIAGKNGAYSSNIENGKDGTPGNRGLEGKAGKITTIKSGEEIKRDTVLELNLKKQEHVEAFFEDFGGAQAAKEKYPALYKAVLNTQKKMMSSSNKEESPDDAKSIGFNMGAIRIEGNPKKSLRSNFGAQPEPYIACDSSGTVKNAAMIMVTSEMIDTTQGVMIDSDSSYIKYSDLVSTLACKVAEVGSFNDHEILVTSKYYYVYPDNTCGSSNVKTANYTLVNGEKSITEFVVDNPKIKSENVTNKYINIVYDRTPKNGEKADYSYDAPEIEIIGNKVKTILPISGYFKVASFLEPKGFSSVVGLKLVYKEETVVNYSYNNLDELNNYFRYTKDPVTNCYRVDFNFNKDWRAYLDKSRYYDGTYITDTQLRWSFRYEFYRLDDNGQRMKDDKGDEIVIELGLCINSEATPPSEGEYNKSKNNKVVIPYIYIQWGCFHKDTLIKMADGSTKRISEIQIGDSVMTNDKRSVVVTESYKGNEETLICIVTETGRTLKVTANHPLLTEHGKMKACNLVVSSKVYTESGLEKIEDISNVAYKDLVYNLDCAGALLIANGIIAGDFICQNEAESKKHMVSYSKETLEIMEDLKKMSEDFKRNKSKK